MKIDGRPGPNNPDAQIHLRALTGNFDMRLALGSAPITFSGGAIYEGLQRPQQIAMTRYVGNDLLRVEAPVLLDGWAVEGMRTDVGDRLERILSICFGENGNPSPSFKAYAPTLPFSGTVFKMDGLPDLTDEPPRIRGEGGTLFRQALTLKLVQFVDPADLKFAKHTPPPVRVGSAVNLGGAHSVEVVSEGETYLGVAARVYDDAGRGPEIMRANGAVNPFERLHKGKRLRLPQGE